MNRYVCRIVHQVEDRRAVPTSCREIAAHGVMPTAARAVALPTYVALLICAALAAVNEEDGGEPSVPGAEPMRSTC
nr:unnamed protein product [Digitaria exilis]